MPGARHRSECVWLPLRCADGTRPCCRGWRPWVVVVGSRQCEDSRLRAVRCSLLTWLTCSLAHYWQAVWHLVAAMVVAAAGRPAGAGASLHSIRAQMQSSLQYVRTYLGLYICMDRRTVGVRPSRQLRDGDGRASSGRGQVIKGSQITRERQYPSTLATHQSSSKQAVRAAADAMQRGQRPPSHPPDPSQAWERLRRLLLLLLRGALHAASCGRAGAGAGAGAVALPACAVRVTVACPRPACACTWYRCICYPRCTPAGSAAGSGQSLREACPGAHPPSATNRQTR